MPNLFDAVVPEERLHQSFRSLRDDPVHLPARELMQRAFDALDDADGNFREQFNDEVGQRVESWGEGIDVFHNPHALHPLPDGLFPSAADTRLENGLITAVMPPFHPISSTTIMARSVSD